MMYMKKFNVDTVELKMKYVESIDVFPLLASNLGMALLALS